MDEPTHIQAGYLQIFRHSSLTNMEHPPLAKDFAGVGLKFLGTPIDAPEASEFNFPQSGFNFLFHNRISPDRLLAAARAPMLLFFFALLLVVFGTAQSFFGMTSGFVALVLVAFEPNFLAHAGIVHTDVPVTLFWLAFVLSWARLLAGRNLGRMFVASILLGCALATKFSAIYLVPTALLVALGERTAERKDETTGGSRGLGRRVLFDAGSLAIVFLTAALVLLAIYQPAVSGMKVSEQQALIHRYLQGYFRSPRSSDFIASIAPFSRGLAHYLAGLVTVGLQSTAEAKVSFLNGRISLRGFPSYFLVAFLVKTGPAFLLASGLALGLALLRRRDRRDAILWLPVAYYLLFSIGSNFNIGVRHLLPIYPFLAIAASRCVADLNSISGRFPSKLTSFLVAAVCGLQIATAVRTHPYELSYFNLLAGGTKNGYRVLSDSNVDWGLDLRRLSDEIRRRGVRDPTIVYFGGDSPYDRMGVPDFVADPRVRGSFVAISASLWDFGPPYYSLYGRFDLAKQISNLIERLHREGRPVGRIGGSTFLYELPPGKKP